MIIPDCRSEYLTDWNGNVTNEANPYYEGNLKDDDRKEVIGYDMCAQAVQAAFCNLDCMETPDYISRNKLEKVAKDVALFVAKWLESDRDQMIVSIIDSYEDS